MKDLHERIYLLYRKFDHYSLVVYHTPTGITFHLMTFTNIHEAVNTHQSYINYLRAYALQKETV